MYISSIDRFVDELVQTSILNTILQRMLISDSSITLQLLTFITHLAARQSAIRHILLILDITHVLNAVTDIFPLQTDIMMEVLKLVRVLAQEEIVILYLVKSNVFNLFSTVFITTENTQELLRAAVESLVQMCIISGRSELAFLLVV